MKEAMMAERQEAQQEKDKECNVSKDFRIRYQVGIDDIKYVKSRQWAVTYYLLLLYVAIIGFSKTIGLNQMDTFCWQRVVLTGIATGIAVLGIHFLWDFQTRLAAYRRSLIDDVLPNLSQKFEESQIERLKKRYESKKWQKKPKEEHCKKSDEIWYKKYTSDWRGFWRFTLWFMSILVGGACFAVYYLFWVLNR